MFKKRHATLTKLCSYGGNTSERFERITVCTMRGETLYFGLAMGKWHHVEMVHNEVLKLTLLNKVGSDGLQFSYVDTFLNNNKVITVQVIRHGKLWTLKNK